MSEGLPGIGDLWERVAQELEILATGGPSLAAAAGWMCRALRSHSCRAWTQGPSNDSMIPYGSYTAPCVFLVLETCYADQGHVYVCVCGHVWRHTLGGGTLGRDKRQGPPNSEVGHTLAFEAHLAQGFCSSPLTIPLPPNFPNLLSAPSILLWSPYIALE